MSAPTVTPGRAVFTLALGKDVYFRMAFALARSFLRHGTGGGLDFVLVTDRPVSERPPDLSMVRWIEVPPGTYGSGFCPKLYLDKLAPAEQSLFVDADCLVVRSLVEAFDVFAGKPVGVLGRAISSGEWFGDVATTVRRLGVPNMPRFNGGVYYLEPGVVCDAIYATARQLLPRYDELGFVRLRGSENDEVLMSAALAIHEVPPVLADGWIMHTAMEAPGGLEIDALMGSAVLYNPKGHPKHFDWTPLERMEPAIVHFLGADPADHPYSTEIRALELVAKGRSVWSARAWAVLTSSIPWLVIDWARSTLRPVYRRLYGVRAVRPTVR